MSDYQGKVHRQQGGDVLVVESGGEIKIEAGGKITNDGTQASAITSLTDSSGGSADGTVEAVSGSGADSAINNNFAELAAKQTAILAALRGAGIIAS